MRVGRVFVESMTLVALLVSACTSESAPRHAPTPATSGSSRNSISAASGVAVLLDREPVVGPAGDEAFVNPGAVVFHGGRFHMLANSFTAYPGPSTVRHLTSEDGIRWRAASTKPVFRSSEVPFGDQNNAFFMSAYVESGGDWVAFFYTYHGGCRRDDEQPRLERASSLYELEELCQREERREHRRRPSPALVGQEDAGVISSRESP